MIRTLILAAALGTLICATTACNTVHGFGKDVKSVGTATEKAAS